MDNIIRSKGMVVFFLVALVITFTGAYLKVTHREGADTWMMIGISLSAIAIGLGIYDVVTSPISRSRKIIWVLSFLLFGWLGFIFYLIVGKRRNR